MWSLNVPLITWCSKLGDKSSWMLAPWKVHCEGLICIQSQNSTLMRQIAYAPWHPHEYQIPSIKFQDRNTRLVIWSSCVIIDVIPVHQDYLALHHIYHTQWVGCQEVAKDWNILQTPILDNSCKEDLLRVVSNVWSEAIDGTAPVTVRTPYELRSCHSSFEGLEDLGKTYVV